MNNTRKILLGLSLLGATTLVGFSSPASAKNKDKDVKEARKEVRKARKEVRNADSREERRDAREDLRQEREDLREERRENRRENRPGYGYGRPGNPRPGYGYGRPNYSNSTRTLRGVVVQDLKGNDFLLRLSSGQTVRVVAVNGESGRISRGDTLSVTGRFSGSTFNATGVSILNNR